MGSKLNGKIAEFLTRQPWLLRWIDILKESVPVQFFTNYREHIALFLYILWIAGCGYWIYSFIIIEAYPLQYSFITITDPQDARVFLSFGIFGAFFVVLFSLFIVKFIINLLHGSISMILPARWFSFGRTVSYLILLSFAFTYIETAKAGWLTIYNRITELAGISEQYDEIVLKNISDVRELFRNLDDRVEEDGNER